MGAPGSDKAIGIILKWAERDEWYEQLASVFADHFGPVLDDFEMTIEEVIEVLKPDGFAPLFGCAFEDFMTCNFEPDERNVVDDYIKRRGWKESAPVKSYLRALQRSVMSVYEVVGTAPGSHCHLRDLIRGGEPIQVEDRLGSENVVQWDRIAARLLEIRGKTYMSAGVLRLSFDDATEIVQEIRKLEKELLRKVRRPLRQEGLSEIDLMRLPAADVILGEMAPLFTRTWLATMLGRLLDPSLPEVRNFEGEPVQFCETRLPLLDRSSRPEVEARLDALAELTRDAADGPHWSWTTACSSAPAVDHQAGSDQGLQWPGLAEDGTRLLGSVRLERDALILETNSTRRAEHGRDLLAAALGALVGLPLTSIQSPAQVLAEGGADAPRPPAAQLSLSLEEQNEALQPALDRHYRAILDVPLPALDGKTPRQAVRSKSGREKAARWLKYLENQTERRSRAWGQPGYDFAWMWDALKINDLRR
jgi:hypothetical protein